MTQSIKAVPTLVRVTVLAAMIVATSGVLEGAGLPFFSAIGGIVQNFAAAQSEAKRLRDKAAACSRHVNREVSAVNPGIHPLVASIVIITHKQ
jgi:hypothetical protein